MKVWITITAACILVLCVLFGGCIEDGLWDYGSYHRDIRRNHDTEMEGKAIEVAENLNYTRFTNLTRWTNEWANYIDSEVIEEYNRSFTMDRDAGREADITFRYCAWAEFHPEMDLRLKRDRWELLVRVNGDDPFKDGDIRGFSLYMDYEEMFLGHMVNGNWSVDKYSSAGVGTYSSDVDLYLHFNNTYFVKMYLSYDDIWGPLAAYYVETFQFVVLDSGFNVLVIGVHPSPWLVS
ncbi:MAG: hypothetical protein ACMUHY_06540 [Thermoplasmatota archaeon]